MNQEIWILEERATIGEPRWVTVAAFSSFDVLLDSLILSYHHDWKLSITSPQVVNALTSGVPITLAFPPQAWTVRALRCAFVTKPEGFA